MNFPFSEQRWEPEYQCQCLDFWSSPDVKQWFEKHGYTLYKPRPGYEGDHREFYYFPTLPVAAVEEVQYPFAYHAKCPTIAEEKSCLRVEGFDQHIGYAQDAYHRHVALKPVKKDSQELKIAQFMKEQEVTTLQENCILPVLDVLHAERFSVVVMPRWGTDVHVTPFWQPSATLGNAIYLMHCMLKALSFLHKHNILHRDIKYGNVLINHICDTQTGSISTCFTERPRLLSEGRLTYAVFDFSISMMLPSSIDKTTFRLPYRLSWDGSFVQPKDTAQGEFDYDPFAFDVGTMGNVFCHAFQHYCNYIHMLAPFFDRMVTHDIPRRFTASQALEFFETQVIPQIPPEILEQKFPRCGPTRCYEGYDRWEGLPAQFVEKWAKEYKDPPISRFTKVLRWLVRHDYPSLIIPKVRWAFFHLFTAPGRLRTWSVGLFRGGFGLSAQEL